jgi:hypothetical protein
MWKRRSVSPGRRSVRIPGAQRRIAAARKVRENFGVATECGLGRAKTPETVKAIIQLYGEVCAAK